MIRRLVAASLLVAAVIGAPQSGAAVEGALSAKADRVAGLWLTEDRDAHVRIERVNGHYQGTIVWLKEPDYPADDDQGMGGRPKVDRENPDRSRRETSIIGLLIVKGFRFHDDEWQGGTIYDPNNGKTYKCRMWFEGETLRVRGYFGFSLLGRSESWTRVAAPR